MLFNWFVSSLDFVTGGVGNWGSSSVGQWSSSVVVWGGGVGKRGGDGGGGVRNWSGGVAEWVGTEGVSSVMVEWSTVAEDCWLGGNSGNESEGENL